MSSCLLQAGEGHRTAILSLGSRPKPAAKPVPLLLDAVVAKAVDDALIALLPLGTQTAHAPAPLPQPDMPVLVGYERNAMPVATIAADVALVSTLVAHQCGMVFKAASSKPGRFETGFLSGLAVRLLPALFGDAGDVMVAKVTDADFTGEGCTDTQFLVTIPHKPEPVTGHLRLVVPIAGQHLATVEKSGPALQTTHVSARCHLPVRRMSLQQVAGLREGSVLTLERGGDAVLTINGKPFAKGAYQEAAGKRSFRIHEPSRETV